MSRHCLRRFGRRAPHLAIFCLAGMLGLTGCSNWRQTIGIEQPPPDEFAVEQRAPLTIPPDFDLRPPRPGAPRPQEVTAEQKVEQAIDTAGAGAPGNQASEALLPETVSAAADPERTLPSNSLASRLLGANDSSAGGAIEKRQTDPLQGVY